MEKFIEIVTKLKNELKPEPAASSTAQDTPLDELKKLKQLFDDGAITKEEYDEKKKGLLQKV